MRYQSVIFRVFFVAVLVGGAIDVLGADYDAKRIEKLEKRIGALEIDSALTKRLISELMGNRQPPAAGSKQNVRVDPLTVTNEFTIPELGIELVKIVGGEFRMGSAGGKQYWSDGLARYIGTTHWAVDEFQHSVSISKPFLIGKYEVTQSQWQAVMGSTIEEQMNKERSGSLYGQGSDFPIYFVSWDEAMEFCNRLNKREKEAGGLPEGYSYSLPTEAQWEYACRAGTTTETPYGDTISSTSANFDGTKTPDFVKGPNWGRTVAVGSYRPNGWGIFDMIGNVNEWCFDTSGDYRVRDNYPKDGLLAVDPVADSPSKTRIHRGGCWISEARFCRSADRDRSSAGRRSEFIGFRISLRPNLR